MGAEIGLADDDRDTDGKEIAIAARFAPGDLKGGVDGFKKPARLACTGPGCDAQTRRGFVGPGTPVPAFCRGSAYHPTPEIKGALRRTSISPQSVLLLRFKLFVTCVITHSKVERGQKA